MAKASRFDGVAVMSHQAVADLLFKVTGKRLSRARIQQIERKALEKLAAAARAAGLDQELRP